MIIKNYISVFFKKYFPNKRNKSSVPFGKTNFETFQNIYFLNYWGSLETKSGPGSEISSTIELVNHLNSLIVKLKIKSINDIPCGDFNWMKNINLDNIKYFGGDIVPELIKNNILSNHHENIEFKNLDIIKDYIPYADLIVCKDCLVHFSFSEIKESIQNFINSGSKYILTTNFPSLNYNTDIQTGDWRPLNFELPPFSFPKPEMIIYENPNITNSEKCKTMTLWKLENIRPIAQI